MNANEESGTWLLKGRKANQPIKPKDEKIEEENVALDLLNFGMIVNNDIGNDKPLKKAKKLHNYNNE